MFVMFVMFYSAFACALSTALLMDRGAIASDDSIVGGGETIIEQYPWQVSLETGGYHFCGGSIYSENIVVTAAHCLYRKRSYRISVRYGTNLSGRYGNTVSVAAIKLHEFYDPNTYTHDIAIIKLSSPIQFSHRAQPIELAKVRPADNILAHVSGWGHTSIGGFVSNKLQHVAVNILNLPACSSQRYNYADTVMDETMICAYTAGKDACQGDSGGPLVVDDTLVGVVSWGRGCAEFRNPGVYADIVTLYPWLIKTIQWISERS